MSALATKLRSGVLELSTATGPLYATPSISERIYLIWTFRNFRSLPRQVLNQRQRELIDKLYQAAALRQAAGSPVIGVVENVQLMSDRKATANSIKVVEMAKSGMEADMARAVGSERIAVQIGRRAPSRGLIAPFDLRMIDAKPVSWPSANRKQVRKTSRALAQLNLSRTRARRWPASGVVVAVSAAALASLIFLANARSRPIDLKMDGFRTRSTPVPAAAASLGERKAPVVPERMPKPSAARPVIKLQPPTAPMQQVAATASAMPVAATPAAMLTQPPFLDIPMQLVAVIGIATQPPMRPIASREEESTPGNGGVAREEVAVPANPAPPPRVVIAAAPQSFSYPVAPNPTLTGKVSLKLVIGADGSVREVNIVSGNRALADAAVRAVRRWRYRPAELNGHPAEAETNVTINFVGDEAVSIAYR
jgi:protein TonB